MKLIIHIYDGSAPQWKRETTPELCRTEAEALAEITDYRTKPYWNNPRWQAHVLDYQDVSQDFPTREKPVSLRLNRFGGNDNWSLFFATVAEAEEMLDLMTACQPLDWDRDVVGLGFTFTN